MCIGIPMKVQWASDYMAVCVNDDVPEEIDIRLVGAVSPGDWLLVFLGAARRVLDEGDALLIRKALRGLSLAADGGDTGGMFADLEDREPSLPPHLEQARKAGARTA